MKHNSFKPRHLNQWSVFALVTALNLLPCTPGLWAKSPCAAPDKEPARNELEFKFEGRVESVDLTAQTFQVDGKVFTVTRDSKITKDGKPAKLIDIAVGNSVNGMARQGFNGKFEAVNVTVMERKS